MSATKNPTPTPKPGRPKGQASPTAAQVFDDNARHDLAAQVPATRAYRYNGAKDYATPDHTPEEQPQTNTLAVWHRSLSDEARYQFEQDLRAAGLANAQFWLDAAPDNPLSMLPFYRLDWYRAWFLAHGYADLFGYTRSEVDGTPHACPEWEAKLDSLLRAEFWHLSGPRALPMTEFYHTTTHGLGQLVRLVSECSQRELNPQRKPMWQALRTLLHQAVAQPK